MFERVANTINTNIGIRTIQYPRLKRQGLIKYLIHRIKNSVYNIVEFTYTFQCFLSIQNDYSIIQTIYLFLFSDIFTREREI